MARSKSGNTDSGANSDGAEATPDEAVRAEEIGEDTTPDVVETTDPAVEAADPVETSESPDDPASSDGPDSPDGSASEDHGEAAEDVVETAPASDTDAADARDVEPETAAAERHEEVHEDHHEEEAGPSFASRALTWLVLLLAGAGIGIWAAPKIAPVLPSGMAPVAAWLSPGQPQYDARIADLETRVEAGLGDVSTRIADLAPADDLSASIDAAVADVRSSLGAEIEDLRGRIAQVDDTETRQRLASLESAGDALSAELESLKSQLTGGADAIAGLSEDTVARIDTYQAEVEGLRASLSTQSDQVGALAARIDEVASEADRQIETAKARVEEVETEAADRLSAAAVQSQTAAVRAALADGTPFADTLSTLSADPSIDVPDTLSTAADQGVVTMLQLKDDFEDAAHRAIRASIMAGAGDGLLERSNAYLRAQIASRSLTPQEGLSPDAVLSRMEDALRRDDLAGAIAEADDLPTEAAEAMSGWLEEARRRAAAEEGLEALNSTLPATN